MNQLSPTLRFIRDKRTESNIVEQCLISVKEFIRDKHLDFFVFMDFYSSIAIRFTPDYPQLDEYNFNLLLDCISIILDSSLQSNGNVEETIKFNLHIQSERFYPIFASPILYLLQVILMKFI